MSTIIRWNPIREMAAMQSALDRVFEDAWRGSRATMTGSALALDVFEVDGAYSVVASLPGLSAEQINVSVHDGVLTISGELPEGELDENIRTLLRERPAGKFSRSITLPEAVQTDNVEAAYENGVLTLTLPKLPELQPRTIPVRAGSGTLVSQN
jgi:HSP20 family protein